MSKFKFEKLIRVLVFFSFLIPVLIASSCSSTPKKPAEIFTSRNMAANQLDLANRTANQGRYADALLIIDDVRRTAAGVDDPPLIAKAAIARGNVLFSLGRHDEAFASWNFAVDEGGKNGEEALAALSRVYIARARLVLLIAAIPAGGSTDAAAVEEILSAVHNEITNLKGDSLGEASGWVVAGMAEKELGRHEEAESSVRRAMSVHEKGLYLEEAAYDWYLIASIRSVSGRYDSAIEALRNAIGFDRRAENGFGIASSWQAMGDVYFKTGNTGEAENAYLHAAGIYRAIGLEDLAVRAESKMNRSN